MDARARIYVAGHTGMVGSAILRRLRAEGFQTLLTRDRAALDLREQAAVRAFFAAERPEYVFVAAAKVGGIRANDTFGADFIHDNLLIAANVVAAAHETGVKKLLFLGSSCIYPKFAPQPMREESFLDGKLEPTNEPYAVAKIAGITMCRAYRRQYGDDFISAMPTNLYGPWDNFDLENSHVLPALMRRFHEAKLAGLPEVTLWGTGSPRREFLHVDDLADACVRLMERYSGDLCLNVGTGEDLTIAEAAETVRRVVGYRGDIRWDSSKPDGAPRKLLDVTRLHELGWRHRIGLEEGLRSLYEAFLDGRRRG
ncbi:MAG TPA: GDP-L-fucose synthase [Desulfovibrio sp.]|jgi:GDP-L-fucose synthase|uniref:GDP-L-fucose synthase n=1 Tax=Desulfovibrio sp. TaxID=885 RepID=UPI002D14BFBC|nr:GDP-L-fucose synthase [Desulfovibrio sp.]HMM38044.1 GDP-L-fucose synthase [Desulfovibrio sp.]